MNIAAIQKAAEMGYASSQCTLGMLYLSGGEVKRDIAKARYWLESSAAAGNTQAMIELSKLGSTNNQVEGSEWVLRAALSGNTEATEELLRTLGRVPALTLLAEHGNSKHQLMLGLTFLEATDTPKDLDSAANWLSRAASQDSADALFYLGRVYLDSDYSEHDPSHGWKLISDAAKFGSAKALLALYERTPDHQKSEVIDLLIQAASKGELKAQIELSITYSLGEYVKLDDYAAYRWCRRAAEQGDARSQFLLGTLLYYGLGCEKNSIDSDQWIRKAALQGYQPAVERLEKFREQQVAEQVQSSVIGKSSLQPSATITTRDSVPIRPRKSRSKKAKVSSLDQLFQLIVELENENRNFIIQPNPRRTSSVSVKTLADKARLELGKVYDWVIELEDRGQVVTYIGAGNQIFVSSGQDANGNYADW